MNNPSTHTFNQHQMSSVCRRMQPAALLLMSPKNFAICFEIFVLFSYLTTTQAAAVAERVLGAVQISSKDIINSK